MTWCASEASCDASQRAGSSHGTVHTLRIGSYNVGVDQNMLLSRKACKYLSKAEDIISTCVQDGVLHIMNFCELGGHRQGLPAAGINAQDFKIFLGPEAPFVSVNSNYLTAWGFVADTTQFGVKLAKPSKTHELLSWHGCEPELVVHTFEVGVGVRLILGNLHIRIPHGVQVSKTFRKDAVQQAMRKLETDAPSDSATQSVVQVLVGDCNLNPEMAEEAIQPMQPAYPCWRRGLASAFHHCEAGRRSDFRQRRQCSQLLPTRWLFTQRAWH